MFRDDEHPTNIGLTRFHPAVFRTIKGQLFLLLFAVLIPVILVQLLIYHDRLNTRRTKEMEANLEMARAIGKAFDRFTKEILKQEFAVGLALSPSLPPTSPEASQLFEKIRNANLGLQQISWVDPGGCILASTDRRAVGLDVSDRFYFKEIANGRSWSASGLIKSKLDGSPVFTLNSGVRDGSGRLIGVILAVVDTERLEGIFAVERFDGGDTTIIDQNGRAVLRHPWVKWRWDDRDLSKAYPVIHDVLKGKETSDDSAKTPDGKRLIYAMTPIRSIGWAVWASRTEKEAVAPVMAQIYRNVGILFLVVLASFASAAFASRRISSPIEALRKHALSLKNGKWSEQVHVHGPVEVEEFAHAFNLMAHEILRREQSLEEINGKLEAQSQDLLQQKKALKAAKVQLEQKVQERTADLQKANAALKALSSRTMTAQEEERRAIARDLHDTVLQKLAYAKMSLGMKKRQMETGNSPPDASFMTDVAGLVKSAIDDIRSIMEGLRPSMLDDLGLISTMRCYCREHAERFSSICELEERIELNEEVIPEPLKITIFRLLQEALNNIVKHSGADHVLVTLKKNGKSIELRVSDDGVGFDPSKDPFRKGEGGGFGITSMKERAELSGGTLTILTRKGQGTTVAASWDLPDAARSMDQTQSASD